MSAPDVLNLVLAVGAFVYLTYRQMVWTVVTPRRAWRTPLVLLAVGGILLQQDDAHLPVAPGAIGVMALEVALSAGVGFAIGALAHLRRTERDRADRSGPQTSASHGSLEARNGLTGLALWLALVATRVTLSPVADALGATLSGSAGAVLVSFGINRICRSAAILTRDRRARAR